MTSEPQAPGPSDDELDDTERTVEELVEILATGGQIEAYLGDTLSFHVSIAEVNMFVRVPLDPRAVAELAAGLPGALNLFLPPMEHAVGDITETDTAENALLGRALEARAKLLGTPDPRR